MNSNVGKGQPRQQEQHAQRPDGKKSRAHWRDRMFGAPRPSAVWGLLHILEAFAHLISRDLMLRAKDSQLRNEINHNYKNWLWEVKRDIKERMVRPLKARNMG